MITNAEPIHRFAEVKVLSLFHPSFCRFTDRLKTYGFYSISRNVYSNIVFPLIVPPPHYGTLKHQIRKLLEILPANKIHHNSVPYSLCPVSTER